MSNISSRVTLEGLNLRWDACSRQDFGLHGVEAFALADAELDLHPVVSVVLEEEAVVDYKLGVGSCAVKDVDLREERSIIYTILHVS